MKPVGKNDIFEGNIRLVIYYYEICMEIHNIFSETVALTIVPASYTSRAKTALCSKIHTNQCLGVDAQIKYYLL